MIKTLSESIKEEMEFGLDEILVTLSKGKEIDKETIAQMKKVKQAQDSRVADFAKAEPAVNDLANALMALIVTADDLKKFVPSGLVNESLKKAFAVMIVAIMEGQRKYYIQFNQQKVIKSVKTSKVATKKKKK